MIHLVLWSAALTLAVLGSFLFSGAETGMYAANRIRLRARREAGSRIAARTLDLLREPTLLIAVILVGNNLANNLASLACIQILLGAARPDPDSITLWNTLILTPVLFVLGEITPKDCFRRRADTWFPAVTGVFSPLVSMARSIRRVLAVLLRLPRRPRPRPTAIATRREIELSFEESAEDGALSGDQGRLALNILAMRETRLDAVARPLTGLGAVREGATVDEAVEAARETGAARVLVEGLRGGEASGQVILHELVGAPGDSNIGPFVRPLTLLPGDMTAMRALLSLRTGRHGLAVVTEGGRPVGVVTVKDLAEEVVGELPGW